MVIVAIGEPSGSASVAICGSSLSLNKERPSGAGGPEGACLGRAIGVMLGSDSRGSGGSATACEKPSSTGCFSTLELLRDNGWDGISGDTDGSFSSADLSSALPSDSLSSSLRL